MRGRGHRAVESVISEILGKFQAGEGGGIFHAGAAVPARLTPTRLRSAAGGVEAPGAPDLRHRTSEGEHKPGNARAWTFAIKAAAQKEAREATTCPRTSARTPGVGPGGHLSPLL